MRFQVWDEQIKEYVAKLEAIKFDHLGEGRPITFVADGKEWSLGTRYRLVIRCHGEQ